MSERIVTVDTKKGREIEVGDIVGSLGRFHRVVEIVDYSGNPWGFEGRRRAKGSDGWGITLDPDTSYEVA